MPLSANGKDSSRLPKGYSDLAHRRSQTLPVSTPLRAQIVGWGWFLVWALLGSALAVAAVSLGPLLFVPTLVAIAVLMSRPASRRSVFGLVAGIGVLLLCVSWLYRQGPGTTCWHTATASGCDEHLNPLPWLVAGLVLFVGGIVAHLRTRAS